MSDVTEFSLGSMLLSVATPLPGFEVAYHRWYERDHFYAGMLTGPACFAGRRWVATRALRALAFPADSPIDRDRSRGAYLHTYWIAEGHHDAFVAWAVGRVNALHAAGRMFAESRQIHTTFCRYRWAVSRDADGVPPELALDHPFAGVAVVAVDAADPADPAAADTAHRAYLEAVLPGSPVASVLAFEPLPLPEGAPSNVPRAARAADRSFYLHFLDADPRACWESHFRPQAAALAARGVGKLVYAAGFVPTVPGTDRYTDEL